MDGNVNHCPLAVVKPGILFRLHSMGPLRCVRCSFARQDKERRRVCRKEAEEMEWISPRKREIPTPIYNCIVTVLSFAAFPLTGYAGFPFIPVLPRISTSFAW